MPVELCRLQSANFYLFNSSAAPREVHSFPTRRSSDLRHWPGDCDEYFRYKRNRVDSFLSNSFAIAAAPIGTSQRGCARSEEHTSELQSRGHLVCRLLLEKKKEITKVTALNEDKPIIIN